MYFLDDALGPVGIFFSLFAVFTLMLGVIQLFLAVFTGGVSSDGMTSSSGEKNGKLEGPLDLLIRCVVSAVTDSLPRPVTW